MISDRQYRQAMADNAAMGTAPDPPTGMTHFVGICDECRAVKPFATARARDLWEQFHPHDDEEGPQ